MEKSDKQTNPYFNTPEFRQEGTKMVNMIVDLYEGLGEMPVQPDVQPGFLRNQFSYEPPQEGSCFDKIIQETKEKIFPGVTQWQHPGFFAYYPSTITHPSVIADMFASTFHSPSFMWNVSPSHTELENMWQLIIILQPYIFQYYLFQFSHIVVDWIAQMLKLPEVVLLKNEGGGSMSNGISDAVFQTIHAAKMIKIKQLGIPRNDPKILKFVGYFTQQCFPAWEKTLMIKDITEVRRIPIQFNEELQNFQCDVAKFEEIIEKDIKDGFIPMWLNSTLGTTPTCAYDQTEKLTQICQKYQIWHNVDAAYAGMSWFLPEYRNKVNLEGVDSILLNGGKMFGVGTIGSFIYVRNKKNYCQSFMPEEEPTFTIYQNKFSGYNDVTDYSNWQVGFGRRWNNLKVFYVLKYFGLKGMQEFVQSRIDQAKYFASLVEKSDIFKLYTKPELTLVCFRLIPQQNKDFNMINKQLKLLLDTDTQKGYITPSTLLDTYFLRFVVCNPNTTIQHIDTFWEHLQEKGRQILDKFDQQ